MATTRGLAPELVEGMLDYLFFKTFTMQERTSTRIFKQRTATKAFVDDIQVAGLGRFQLKPEGVPVAYSDPVQGARRRTVMLTFGLGFRVTMEMREDEETDVISRMPEDLAESAEDSMERLAYGLINDAFAGSTYTGPPEGDGTRRSLFNTGHVPLRNASATQSNRLSPGVALSTAGLEAALTIFRTTQSEEERYVNNVPRQLLIHPDNEWTAAQLMDSQFEVGTAENQINPVSSNRVGLSTVMSPYITDTDSWSLWGDKHQVSHFTRKKLTRTKGMDSQSLDQFFIAHYRENYAVLHWRGTVGSAP